MFSFLFKRHPVVSNGNHAFVKGIIFDPGAMAFCPTRGVVPPTQATGTGYVPRENIEAIQPAQVFANQTAPYQGVGVELGTSLQLSPLVQDNSISQTT